MRTGVKPEYTAVEPTDSQVNDELTLGYDSDFESQWWRIEIGIWITLSIVVILGLTGLLGRGPLAHERRGSADGSLEVDFQRVARYKTPEIMIVRLTPDLYRQRAAHLWLNREIIEEMGLQRIIPQPLESRPGENGIEYVFPVQNPNEPTLIRFVKEASKPGIFTEEVRVDSQHDVFLRSIAMP